LSARSGAEVSEQSMAIAIEDRLASLESRVRELEDALARTQRPRIGITVEEARARVGQPVERGPEQFERLQRIFGRFSGPEDLSSRMREYLYGDRE
jgi:hypothetical protein